MRDVRIGVIGTGRAADAHIKAFRSLSGVELSAIVGQNADLTRQIANKYEIPWCPTTAEELIESSRIDAVVLAIPPFYQPDLAVLSFTSGKHVLCEKPIGVSYQESVRVYDAWIASKRVGMVNFCYRLIPQIEEFKSRLAAGACGHVHTINAEWILSSRLNKSLTYHWKGQRELGGGVLQNYGVHIIDYLFHDIPHVKILGAKSGIFVPFRADASGNIRTSTGDEVITVLFDIGNSAVASIHLSLVTMPPIGHRIIARGSKGTIEVSNLHPGSPGGPFSLWYYSGNSASGECLSDENMDLSFDLSCLFVRVCERFIKSIREGIYDNAPNIKNALQVSRMVEEIHSYCDKTRK